ncbi:MAG: hypothetical protein II661_04310 [Bacteroidales bacterium]|nr:hypothetical protein [Bacteroidales bacterium]
MAKIDFTNLQICSSFDEEALGKTHGVNIAKTLGNLMKFGNPTVPDIGFEELAKKIYFSDGPVEIPDEYKSQILSLLDFSPFNASIKRTLKKELR